MISFTQACQHLSPHVIFRRNTIQHYISYHIINFIIPFSANNLIYEVTEIMDEPLVAYLFLYKSHVPPMFIL